MNKITIIKMDGTEMPFDTLKIECSIRKANADVSSEDALSDGRIRLIASEILSAFEKKGRATTDEIRDCVEEKIIELGSVDLAKQFITYRYRKLIEKYKELLEKDKKAA